MHRLESLAADVRVAARHFARKPLAAATIVLVLALGIGVNSALFSVVQAFTTRPAPAVPRDDALVRVLGAAQASAGARWEQRGFSLAELRALEARTTTFAAVAGWTAEDLVVDRGDGAGPRAVRAQFVTPDFFRALGVAPALGSDLRAASGAGADVVISHALWAELFGGSRDALGAVLRVNDVAVRVVGVAPPRFQGAVPGQGSPALWLAAAARSEIVRSARWETDPDSALFAVFARLAPGVAPEQASAIARTVAARAAAASATRATFGAEVVPLSGTSGRSLGTPAGDQGTAFAAVGAIALLVLLVACTNVSSLLVAAAVARRHEIATRLSLGASRARLVRQLLTESALLATAGGAAGLLLYWWITRLVASRVTDVDIAPDLATVSFTLAIALATGVGFGLSPALHATRGGVAAAMRDSGGGATRRSRLQHAFVVAQIVCTQPLLVVLAVLLSATVEDDGPRLAPGVGERVVAARLTLRGDAGGYDAKVAKVRALAARIAERPEVAAVVPEAGAFDIRNVTVLPAEGDARTDARADGIPPTRVHVEGTAPGYFALLGVPIVRGRAPALADTAGREMAVVLGSDLARALFGAADPIGRRLAAPGARDARPMVVVGVFDATRATTRGSVARVYTADGARWRDDALLVRTRAPAGALVPALHRLLRAEAPELPVSVLATLHDLGRAERRSALQVAGGAAAVGALALGLASLGLYALVALTVGQRTREIGVRLALGASPRRVAGAFFASGLRLTVIALLVGLPVSLGALKIVLSQVVLPSGSLPLAGGGIALVVLGVAAAATWVPARRAAGLDPLRALRAE